MPTLLAWVLVALGSRGTAAGSSPALSFATVGDVAGSTSTFEVGMVGFLAMQLCYIAGFLRLGAGLEASAMPPRGTRRTCWSGRSPTSSSAPPGGPCASRSLVYSLALCVMATVAARSGVAAGSVWAGCSS